MQNIQTEKLKKINELLKMLLLPGIRNSIEEIFAKGKKEESEIEDIFLELLKIEYENRKNNRIQRYLKQSKLPLEKNIETFNLKRLPPATRSQVKVLMDGSFLNRCENVLFFGKPGSGKTHLLCAIGLSLIYSGRRIYFTTCSFLVQALLKAKRDLKIENYLRRLSKYEGIIIDDIGYVQQNREEMEVLFTFLAERYERGSVLLTSNLRFSEWNKIFQDPMTTAAAIDRLVHHSIILELNLPSYRLEEAKTKKPRK